MIPEPYRMATIPVLPSFGEPPWDPNQKHDRPFDPDLQTGEAKLKVIVIDDEALIAETVAEILNGAGLQATPVYSPVTAIKLAETVQPDVVLSDVIMPEMNGIEAGIKIREIVPHCRVILFSGQAETVDLLEKARQRGHRFDIVGKPVKPEQLISVIRSGPSS